MNENKKYKCSHCDSKAEGEAGTCCGEERKVCEDCNSHERKDSNTCGC